ncbi:hypothetical protein SGFS_025560 [Streptomyces graminofaciens]|uniref:Uncharacterized protein n=1 Tax=Streptomyces graminofaciens TaxID=68212 RepID=A0ABN5VET3_9ACTN|nr:hypothetical protein SGFS_025560 [Streptomyces graminofaciens]
MSVRRVRLVGARGSGLGARGGRGAGGPSPGSAAQFGPAAPPPASPAASRHRFGTPWASTRRCGAPPPAPAEIASLFTAAPHVSVSEQADSGHNLGVGHSGRAYHLKVLSFAEECAVTRETGATAPPREGRAG